MPSGPAAYTFDQQGNFVGWTPDSGEFESPRVVYSRAATEERLTMEELIGRSRGEWNAAEDNGRDSLDSGAAADGHAPAH
jgi:hypothetical protein